MVLFTCPHCAGEFIVEEHDFNCKIARHFVFHDGNQLSPHASQETCEKALQQGGFGCAQPFRIENTPDGWIAVKCDFI